MKTVVWKPVEYPGMEYCQIDRTESLIQVAGGVIAVIDQTPFHLAYRLICDPDYTIHSVYVAHLNERETLRLTSDGRGNWFDQWQKPLPELEGCIDVDISATPFTNTLPIRRIQWRVGQVETFRMVYIRVPDLSVQVDEQRYTCLEKTENSARFLYESVDSDFKATITVDSDGLVVDYPGLFERVWSS